MKKIVTIIVLATALTATSVALGNAAEDAKVWFQEGMDLFNKGSYAEAAAKFQQAYDAKPTWKLLFNIGQANSAAKRYGLALQAFELYLVDGGDDIPVDRKEEILSEVRRLRDMVASLDVKGPVGAVVFVDNVKRGQIPLEGIIKVAAGKRHQVVVTLNGATLLDRTVRLSGGDTRTLTANSATPVVADNPTQPSNEPKKEDTPPDDPQVPLTSAAGSQTDSADGDPADSSVPGQVNVATGDNGTGKKLKIAGISLLAVGVAAGVVGGILGGQAISQVDGEVTQQCAADDNLDQNPKMCTSTEAIDAYDKAYYQGVISTIGVVAGATIGATGAALLIVGILKGKNESVTASRVTPMIGHGFGGIMLNGQF